MLKHVFIIVGMFKLFCNWHLLHNQIKLHTVRDKRIIISLDKKIVLFGAVSLEVVWKKKKQQ
jgi:hypothetical protein